MAPPPAGRREAAALIFCDLFGTMRLMAEEGDLVASAALRDFFEHSGRLAEEEGCLLIKFIGDGFIAAFRDASKALPMALAVQELLTASPALAGHGLGFRFSIHFGSVMLI